MLFWKRPEGRHSAEEDGNPCAHHPTQPSSTVHFPFPISCVACSKSLLNYPPVQLCSFRATKLPEKLGKKSTLASDFHTKHIASLSSGPRKSFIKGQEASVYHCINVGRTLPRYIAIWNNTEAERWGDNSNSSFIMLILSCCGPREWGAKVWSLFQLQAAGRVSIHFIFKKSIKNEHVFYF